MSEKTIRITEKDGGYQIQNTGLSDFEIIGILECALFDLKTASGVGRAVTGEINEEKPLVEASMSESGSRQSEETSQSVAEPPAKETAPEQNHKQSAPEIRMRINNAVKAIKSLGGEVSEPDLGAATDEELQAELEELKNQYKRLKASQKLK